MKKKYYKTKQKKITKNYTKKVRLHRVIMEKHLGRKLTQEEVVHHVDGDTQNNNINNLHLFPNQSKHAIYHMGIRRLIKNELNRKGIFFVYGKWIYKVLEWKE